MFKQLTIVFLGVFILLSFASLSIAEYRKVKAVGMVEKGFFDTEVGARKKAIIDARKKALDKYISSFDSQRVRILSNVKDELYENIDVYVPEIFELNSGRWEGAYWKLDVEASINEAQIEEVVNRYSKENKKKEGEQLLSFVFVAREVESVRSFEDKKTEIIMESELNQEKTSESEDDYLVSENSKTYEKTSGGSVEKKSERIKYKSYIPEEIDIKVTEIFNKAEFDVVPAFEIDIDTVGFKKDFIEADDIANSTKKGAVDKARAQDINYLAISMLDVGREQIDPVTGLNKIYVSVIGYILDLNGKFAKKICSIGPIQYSGLGENPKVAKINALNSAASSAAKDLVDQLRVKQSF